MTNNEFFGTIQGEATYTGTPSLFIRTQECPVGCSFCDTKYTWDLDEEDETTDMAVIVDKRNYDFNTGEGDPTHIKLNNEEILKLAIDNNLNHIVFTGGEPCINDLTSVTELLNTNGFSTQIETSGTFTIKASANTWVTVSPKIGKAIKGGYPILDSSYQRANEIKYPVGKMQDVDNLKEIIAKYKLKDKLIWLQPLSTSTKATELCIEQAMLYNWKISVQTHKYINAR